MVQAAEPLSKRSRNCLGFDDAENFKKGVSGFLPVEYVLESWAHKCRWLWKSQTCERGQCGRSSLGAQCQSPRKTCPSLFRFVVKYRSVEADGGISSGSHFVTDSP